MRDIREEASFGCSMVLAYGQVFTLEASIEARAPHSRHFELDYMYMCMHMHMCMDMCMSCACCTCMCMHMHMHSSSRDSVSK